MSDGYGPTLVAARRVGSERAVSLPLVALVGLTLAGLLSLLYLTQTSGVATTGYDIQTLEAEKARWQLRNDQLRLEIARLQALDRVEREAQSRLNMGPPSKAIFIPVDLSSVSNAPITTREVTDEQKPLVRRVLELPGVLRDWLNRDE